MPWVSLGKVETALFLLIQFCVYLYVSPGYLLIYKYMKSYLLYFTSQIAFYFYQYNVTPRHERSLDSLFNSVYIHIFVGELMRHYCIYLYIISYLRTWSRWNYVVCDQRHKGGARLNKVARRLVLSDIRSVCDPAMNVWHCYACISLYNFNVRKQFLVETILRHVPWQCW